MSARRLDVPRHFRRRTPQGNGRIAWYRSANGDGAPFYRLYRRDCRNAIHAVQVAFAPDDPREYIAGRLRVERQRLRDDVDEIDFKLLGLATGDNER